MTYYLKIYGQSVYAPINLTPAQLEPFKAWLETLEEGDSGHVNGHDVQHYIVTGPRENLVEIVASELA